MEGEAAITAAAGIICRKVTPGSNPLIMGAGGGGRVCKFTPSEAETEPLTRPMRNYVAKNGPQKKLSSEAKIYSIYQTPTIILAMFLTDRAGSIEYGKNEQDKVSGIISRPPL